MQTVRLNPEQLGETKLPLSELQLVLMIDMGNEKLYEAREGSAGPHRTQRLPEGAGCVFHTPGREWPACHPGQPRDASDLHIRSRSHVSLFDQSSLKKMQLNKLSKGQKSQEATLAV